MCKSRTGSGKTLAFAIPIVEALDRQSAEEAAVQSQRGGRGRHFNRGAYGRLPRAICVAPTRELAKQVTRQTREGQTAERDMRQPFLLLVWRGTATRSNAAGGLFWDVWGCVGLVDAREGAFAVGRSLVSCVFVASVAAHPKVVCPNRSPWGVDRWRRRESKHGFIQFLEPRAGTPPCHVGGRRGVEVSRCRHHASTYVPAWVRVVGAG